MFCTHAKLARGTDGAAAGRTGQTGPSGDGRVYGTWDFKWPLGAIIQVAFQAWPQDPQPDWSALKFSARGPRETEIMGTFTGYGKLTRIIECLARRWQPETSAVEFRFIHDAEIPQAPDEEFGEGTDQIYDVLVSVAPLPQFQQRQPLGNDAPPAPAKYFLPGSELGRYAQRIDYGVPTTYLGKRQHFGDGDHARADDLAYFNSEEFVHWTIHEFGHVLGLTHEQQNPNAAHTFQLKPTREVARILSAALGYSPGLSDVSEAEVAEELTTTWPVLLDGSGPRFSDFRQYAPGATLTAATSIMSHLYWERLLLNGSESADAGYLAQPTDSDLAMFQYMYPRDKPSVVPTVGRSPATGSGAVVKGSAVEQQLDR